MIDAAKRLLDAWDTGTQVAPLTDDAPALTPALAYQIAAEIHEIRLARGERPVGRKIGFTNPTLWEPFGVTAPIWGWMYDTTVRELGGDTHATIPHAAELRIEPELAITFKRALTPDMSIRDLADAIESVVHGFELVTSPYPDWRFQAADTMAAQGLHAAFLAGPSISAADLDLSGDEPLNGFSLTMTGPEATYQGHAQDVLGGPLRAIAYLVEELARLSLPAIEAGELISTGTFTDAPRINRGECWSTTITGAPIPGLSVTFT